MKHKKAVIILIIVCTFFIGLSIYKKCHIPKSYEECMMRFELPLNGQYKIVPRNISSRTKYKSMDTVFLLYSKEKTFKDKKLKYGKFVTTYKSEYIFGTIDDKYVWIEHEVPIDKSVKHYIRDKLAYRIVFDREYYDNRMYRQITMIPFNDPTYLLIHDDRTIIFNINTHRITWKQDGYYEAPRINFRLDKLECYGEFSGLNYIFNKEDGTLYKKKRFGFEYV